MILRNKELKQAFGLCLGAGSVTVPIAFLIDRVTGLSVLLCWGLWGLLLWFIEWRRYSALRQISRDLDALLLHGTALPIGRYEEGELSLLADQVQKLTRKLTEARDALQKDKTFLADSLADISHQLRTPMTAMELHLSLLQGPEQEEYRERVRDLRSLLQRMQWLVEALLKLSKLDAGTVELRMEEVSLRALLKQATEPFAIAMDIQEQNLHIACEDRTVRCDPTWTAEAIGNVVKNAIEHNPPGGAVIITERDTPIFTEITIEDEGGGFPSEELPRIFDRFYRGKRQDPKNCGIGLSLARSILSAQEATIRAENHGKGAMFTIKFYKQLL